LDCWAKGEGRGWKLINLHSLYLRILNVGEGREIKLNISPPFSHISLIFIHLQNEGETRGREEFLIVLPHFLSSLFIIYPNKVMINYFPFLPLPSITFPSLSLLFYHNANRVLSS